MTIYQHFFAENGTKYTRYDIQLKHIQDPIFTITQPCRFFKKVPLIRNASKICLFSFFAPESFGRDPTTLELLLDEINQILKVQIVSIRLDQLITERLLEKICHFVGEDETWNEY